MEKEYLNSSGISETALDVLESNDGCIEEMFLFISENMYIFFSDSIVKFLSIILKL